MREIKFRAWDRLALKLKPVAQIRFDYEEVIFNDLYDDWRPFKDVILMQYTGLKDKNGKEIYEGDILSHYDGNIVVKYEDDYAGFNICYNIHECIVMNDNIEVIGNIYENLELLK